MSDGRDDSPLPVGKLAPTLLARMVQAYASTDPAVLVGPGIGRDAAAIKIGDAVLVAKTDPITFATKSAAAYLVDINANDLACLGATPRWMLATALLAEGTTAQGVAAQFRELHEACARRGIALIGGHTEVTGGLDRTILVGMLLGDTTEGRLLRPGGARPGDRLLLTKALAIEGTALLATELADRLAASIGRDTVARAARLLTDPGISVVHDAEILLQTGGVTALHDPTEGGLAMGVRELAIAAGCGARLDRSAVPILPETETIARELGLDPVGLLASGSLLAAVRAEFVGPVVEAALRAGLTVAEIGTVTPEEDGMILVIGRDVVELPRFDADEVTRALAFGR